MSIGTNFGFRGGGGGAASGVVAVAVALLVSGLGYNMYVSQNQALDSSTKTQAEVVETGIRADSSRRGGTDYRPQITYSYTYNGQDYTSDNMYPGGQEPDEYSTRSEAKETLDRYEEQTPITVHVPTSNPGQAFIRAEKTSDPLVFIGVGILFLAVGIYRIWKSQVS